MNKIFKALILSLFFIPFFILQAQQNNDIAINLNPAYPKANESVNATLTSYSLDLNNTAISWSVNDITLAEGIGKKNFSFESGIAGETTSVKVIVTTTNGSILTKTISFSPVDLDLLWEAYDSYVPPFYKGKALYSSEGAVKVVAMPNSNQLGGLSFNWEKDGVKKPDSSGYNKNYYYFKNNYLESSNQIGITVSDLFGYNLATNSFKISPEKPKIIFYQKDLNGKIHREKALDNNLNLTSEGMVLIAEPYFFSPKNLNASDLSITWFINNEEVENPESKNTLSIKPAEKESGTALIKVVANNIKTLFQKEESSINVEF